MAASSTTFAITCCLIKAFRVQNHDPRTRTAARLVSYRSASSSTSGSGRVSSGRRLAPGRSLRATASGDALRYMRRPAGRKSADDSRLRDPSAARRQDHVRRLRCSSSVSSRSSCRKYASPFCGRSRRSPCRSRRSISRSKSRKDRPSRSRRCLPDRRLPDPGSPTRIRCGVDGISRRSGLRRAKGSAS